LPFSRQTDESDLSLIAHAIRHRIWVVALCFVAATLAALALTLREEKRYEATSAVLVRAIDEPEREVETNQQLMSLPVVARRTAKRLPGIDEEEVDAAVRTEHQGESNIIQVVATSSSPERAALIANAFARTFAAFRAAPNRGKNEANRIKIVERASPSSTPVSPKPVRNIVFGALIGLALGLSLALLLEQLDRRLKREDDLAEATGLPRLVAVPKLRSFDDKHLGQQPLSPAETEVFRMLRASLRYFNVKREIKSILVTSGEPGEGKTLVAFGLALAAVTSGERVLLIEADLRNPGLSKMLGLPASGGLSQVLSDGNGETFAEAVTGVRAGDMADAIGDATLDVLPAGAIPPNPTELVESQRMKDVIGLAGQQYDFVVIDTPPVLIVSDAIPLLSAVNGVLAVSGLGISTRRSAADLAELLERSAAPTLGVIANFAEHTGRSYEGYGYGRPPDIGGKDPAAPAPTRT